MKLNKNIFLVDKPNLQNNSLPFFAFLLFFSFLAYKTLSPLMNPLIWSAMLSFCLHPVYKKVDSLTHQRFPSLSAVATLILIVICFVVPCFFILASLTKEVSQIAVWTTNIIDKMQLDQVKDPADLIPNWTPYWITKHLVSFLKDSSATREVVQKMAEWSGTALTSLSKVLFRRASSFFFNIIVVAMVTFFFLRDGTSIVKNLSGILPLTEKEKTVFFQKGKNLLNSVIFGVIFSVAIQAVLGGIGWWFCGLPNPSFFGVLMFIFGLFPAGSAVVWIPGAVYLFLIRNIKTGIILLLWGTLIVGTVDNLLRPILISGGQNGAKIPTLLIVIGLFGGVITWGFIGVFLGPITLVLFTIAVDIYKSRLIAREQLHSTPE